MNNSKRVFSVLTALVMFFLITGCGSSEEPEETAKKAETVVATDTGAAEETAQPPKQFDEVCAADVKMFCPKVMPGDGRVAACLYAHTDLLEDECYDATARVGAVLEGVFDGMEAFYAACQVDLEAHCADARAGTGEQMSCLRAKIADLTPGCSAALPGSASTR